MSIQKQKTIMLIPIVNIATIIFKVSEDNILRFVLKGFLSGFIMFLHVSLWGSVVENEVMSIVITLIYFYLWTVSLSWISVDLQEQAEIARNGHVVSFPTCSKIKAFNKSH